MQSGAAGLFPGNTMPSRESDADGVKDIIADEASPAVNYERNSEA
jgi:hypothetical protein